MRRRKKGSGSIVQRPDGRWMGQINLGVVDGKRVRRTLYGKTRDELEAKMVREFPDLLPHDGPYAQTRTQNMAIARARGTHTAREWYAKVIALGTRCYYCGRATHYPMTKDHLTPITRGGSDSIDNLVPACKPCNSAKSNLTEAEFRSIGGGSHG